MVMKTTEKIIDDYKGYLDVILGLSKGLSVDQREALDTILKTQITLLVCMRKESRLGEIVSNFLDY